MKSIALSISFLLFATILFSQNDEVTTKDERISFGLGLNIKQPNLSADLYSSISNHIGYSLEGNFYFNFKSKLILKAGLNISSFQFTLTEYFSTGSSITGGGGIPSSYLKNDMTWSYAGIPIELQFNILGNKNQLYLKGGGEIMYNFFKDHKGEFSENGIVRETDSSNLHLPNKVLGIVTLGIGINFPMNKKIKLYVEPNLEFGVNNAFAKRSIIDESKSRLNTIGCKVGIRF